MNNYQFIQVESRGCCAMLWLNRPDRHNALHGPLIAELHRCLKELAENDSVRVIVLAGRGASFCAGGDLDWMRQQASAPYDENLRDARQLAYTLRTLAQCPKPTLARVQGAALGGGLGLVAACDIAVASRTALFGTPETRVGLTPSLISPYVVGAIGERAARRCFLTGERFSATEAQRLGLVQTLADPEALDDCLAANIEMLSQAAPQAQAHCKWLLAELRRRDPTPEELEETARSLASIRAGQEAHEGIAAFFARRKPAWTP